MKSVRPAMIAAILLSFGLAGAQAQTAATISPPLNTALPSANRPAMRAQVAQRRPHRRHPRRRRAMNNVVRMPRQAF